MGTMTAKHIKHSLLQSNLLFEELTTKKNQISQLHTKTGYIIFIGAEFERFQIANLI